VHIYRGERMKPGRNPWLPGFVEDLLGEDVGLPAKAGKATMARPVQK
jgi:hypothetical protein